MTLLQRTITHTHAHTCTHSQAHLHSLILYHTHTRHHPARCCKAVCSVRGSVVWCLSWGHRGHSLTSLLSWAARLRTRAFSKWSMRTHHWAATDVGYSSGKIGFHVTFLCKIIIGSYIYWNRGGHGCGGCGCFNYSEWTDLCGSTACQITT